MTRICHIDTETTGLNEQGGHEIWEFAAVIDDPADGATREFVWQFRPDTQVRDTGWPKADPEALKVGRFEERFALPEGAPAGVIIDGQCANVLTRGTALNEIRGELRDGWWVGANPGFDERFLRAMTGGLSCAWNYRLTDVECLVQQVMGWPVPRGLRESAEAIGVEVDEGALHTALGDARLVKAVRDKLLGCVLDGAS